MTRNLPVTALFTLFSLGLFAQTINSVTVVPANPTPADEVFLQIGGDLWSSSMIITAITVSQSNNTFTVDVNCEESGKLGLPVLVPFDTLVSLGMLGIGYYDAVVNGRMSGSIESFDGTTWAVLEPLGFGRVDEYFNELFLLIAPNPFSEETTIHVNVPGVHTARLAVYDILGKELDVLAGEPLLPGPHLIRYSGAGLAPGKYYFQLSAGEEAIMRQVLKK